MRKRLLRGLVASAIAVSLAVSAIGCGRDATPNTATDIEIAYWKSGMGDQFLKDIIAGFETKNPEYKVHLKSTEILSEVNQTLLLGEADDTVDMYFSYFEDAQEYKGSFESLDDVLDRTPAGESKKIREKFNPQILEQLKTAEGTHDTLIYGGGLVSIAYNMDMLEGYELPKTSFELEMLVSELTGEDIVPFVHFAPEGYYGYLEPLWQAQYDGLDYYYNTFLACKDPATKVAPHKSVLLKKDGRWQALDAMGKIFTPDTVLNNSNTMQHTQAQTKFLAGEAAMMVNGTWMQNEMKKGGTTSNNIGVMKIPVLSSIIEKCDTIKSDSVLSDVIGEIDEITAGKKQVTLTGDDANMITVAGHSISEKDYKKLYEARNLTYTNYRDNAIMIPEYSNAKEGAKLFLEYFFSDEGLDLYYAATHVAFPVEYSDGRDPDMTGWTDFEKENYSLLANAIPVTSLLETRHDIFKIAGASAYGGVKIIGQLTGKGTGRKSAAEIWNQVEKAINDNYAGWLTDIGLSEWGY